MKARRVIATVAPKGGVGKTFIAKLLHDLLPTRGRRIAPWDLDAATGTFAIYADGIRTFDMTATNNSYSWLDDCYRDDIDDVLIDVPGGRIDDLLCTFGDNRVEALVETVAATGRDLVIVNPIGVMIAETVTAQVTLKAFAGSTARVVIVKNGRFGAPQDFVIYDGVQIGDERRYGATGDLAANVGAETIFLNAFSPSLLAQADAERLRLIEAAGPNGALRLGQLGATRMRVQLATATTDFRGSSLDVDGAVPERGTTR
jgi:CobQ/CobB/MinD/ParA nucleotide binding domain